MHPPATLDQAGIAERIPHAGAMCLLDRLHAWSSESIHCSAASHRAADNPLRTASGLLAPCAIEYAAQAMALHGALIGASARALTGGGAADAALPKPGYLASVRQVQMAVDRLDTIAGRLQVHAERLAGDAQQILYHFTVRDEAGAPLVEGRATVVLDTPIV